MGENPWRSPQQLLQEKIYPVAKSTESPEMRRGIELEPAAREEYCRRTGIMVSPICVQHTEHSWIRASLDGMSEAHDHVVEIKCGERSYQLAESGHVAPYYYAQLQHILQVTGLGEIDYWAYIEPGSGILLRVKRDERYIQDLFQEELAFWRHLSEYRAQPT